MPSTATVFPAFQAHNHQLCIDAALETATLLCQRKRILLSPVRKRVLTIVLQGHRPIGAYQVLDTLNKARDGSKPLAPQTVYRALDFLLENQLVHRLASLNAYIACCRPARPHQAIFMICQSCGLAQELEDASWQQAIQAKGLAGGFITQQACIEIGGLCPSCQPKELPSASRGGT